MRNQEETRQITDGGSHKKRESNAVGAMVAGAIGAGIGGNTGNAIMYGAEGESIAIDFFSREKVDKQSIKCEIIKD